MPSRNPQLLVKELYDLYLKFDKGMKDEGIDYFLTNTVRTQEEQDKLYAQGRTTSGPIVTWTRKSKHIEGKAFDIAIMKDGKITWATKDYLDAGRIGMGIGLDWGGSWRKKDYPHFQLKEVKA